MDIFLNGYQFPHFSQMRPIFPCCRADWGAGGPGTMGRTPCPNSFASGCRLLSILSRKQTWRQWYWQDDTFLNMTMSTYSPSTHQYRLPSISVSVRLRWSFNYRRAMVRLLKIFIFSHSVTNWLSWNIVCYLCGIKIVQHGTYLSWSSSHFGVSGVISSESYWWSLLPSTVFILVLSLVFDHLTFSLLNLPGQILFMSFPLPW